MTNTHRKRRYILRPLCFSRVRIPNRRVKFYCLKLHFDCKHCYLKKKKNYANRPALERKKLGAYTLCKIYYFAIKIGPYVAFRFTAELLWNLTGLTPGTPEHDLPSIFLAVRRISKCLNARRVTFLNFTGVTASIRSFYVFIYVVLSCALKIIFLNFLRFS